MVADLADQVADAVGAVSAQLRLRFAAAGQESELGFVTLATLRHLVRHGPKSVTDLAEPDHVTPQAVSLRVAPLVAAGLVLRETDEKDARRAILIPTTAGEQVVAEATGRAHDALREAIDDLAPRERRALEAAIPALEHLGERLAASKSPG